MAKATITKRAPRPAYVNRLASALRTQLPGAQVRAEKVRRNRYRFIVIWDRFDRMGHPERQRKVWDIAQAVVEGPKILDVAMILTLGRNDLPERS